MSEKSDSYVLTRLFEHNTWANLKLLDFCEGLSDAQLDTTAVGCYGTIRDTLRHTIGAETGYVERVSSEPPPNVFPHGGPFPGFAALKTNARWTGVELLKMALSAREDTLVRNRPPRDPMEYKLADLVVQAIDHSAEHRTQVSAIITLLGLEPPDMSGWNFMQETGALKEL